MLILAFVVAAVVALLIGALSFPVFFAEPSSFARAVRYSIIPDIVSIIRGEYWEDLVSSARLGLWCAVCGLPAFLVFQLIRTVAE